MALIHVSADTDADQMIALIEEHGHIVVDNIVPDHVVDALVQEMKPHVDAVPYGADGGALKKTRRLGGLLGRSATSRDLIAHDKVLKIAEHVLGRKASTYQLDCTLLNCIEPGERAQFLHRDEMAYDAFPWPLDFEVLLSTVWALTDFTAENGATRVVPGSHKSPPPAEYTQADTVPAEMTKGSVLIYSGKLIHGGGANMSDMRRDAMLINYSIGWLRQEENQYLTVPLEQAREFDPKLQRLMGYDMGAPGLGHVRNFEHPLVGLYPDMSYTPPEDDRVRNDEAHARSQQRMAELAGTVNAVAL